MALLSVVLRIVHGVLVMNYKKHPAFQPSKKYNVVDYRLIKNANRLHWQNVVLMTFDVTLENQEVIRDFELVVDQVMYNSGLVNIFEMLEKKLNRGNGKRRYRGYNVNGK